MRIWRTVAYRANIATRSERKTAMISKRARSEYNAKVGPEKGRTIHRFGKGLSKSENMPKCFRKKSYSANGRRNFPGLDMPELRGRPAFTWREITSDE